MSFLISSFSKEGPRLVQDFKTDSKNSLRAQGSQGFIYSKDTGHCGAALDLGDGPD